MQLEAIAGRDDDTRILTQMAADRAPDVMKIGDDAVPMFVDKGAFASLDDYIASAGFDMGIYLPGVLEPGKWNSQQYLLPKDFSTWPSTTTRSSSTTAGVPYLRTAGPGRTHGDGPGAHQDR